MAVVYTYPRIMYPYLGNAYPQFKDPKYFAMDGEEQSKLISGIAKVIVNNNQELKDKLVQLGLVCSCTIPEATYNDLSDIVVENIENKEFQKWLSQKVYENETGNKVSADGGDGGEGGSGNAGAVLGAVTQLFTAIGIMAKGSGDKKSTKEQYKQLIATEAVKYKAEQENNKRTERATNSWMIAGGAVLLLGVGALIFFGTGQKNKTPNTTIA